MIFALLVRSDTLAALATFTKTPFSYQERCHILGALHEEPWLVLDMTKRTALAQELGWKP